MLTPLEFAICVSAIGALAGERNAQLRSAEWQHAIGHNICAAANAQAVDPMAVAGIILNENGNFVLGLMMPAAKGHDVGLCQANTHYQAHRPALKAALHPYACAEIVAQILRENVERYGKNWRAVAAYWNPRQAEQGTAQAVAYYNRWTRNYGLVQRYFERARTALATTGEPAPTYGGGAGAPRASHQESTP
jgi:hypothetical protein